MMHEHLNPILHLGLEEDGYRVEQIVAHLKGVQVTQFERHLVAVRIGQVVLVRVPEPVAFTLDGRQAVRKEKH